MRWNVPEKNVRNIITESYIDSILRNSDISTSTLWDKCTVVAVRLPNGFVLTESSGCVDKANYDSAIGYEICMRRIKDKLWALEGYRLQCELGAS